MIGKESINRKGMAGKIFIAACAVLIIGGFYTTEANALPPSEVITCQGCSLLQESVDRFSTWVKKDSAITLTGPAGYQSYVWTGGGQTVSGQSFTFKIVSDVVFTLTLDGNKAKTVQIKLASSVQNICLPDVSEIGLNNGFVGNTFPVGSKFLGEVTLSNKNKCPATVKWEVEQDSGLLVEADKNHPEQAWIIVLFKPTSGKNPVIRVNVSNGISFNIRERTIIIIDNAPQSIKSIELTPNPPLSYKKVEIKCNECFSGSINNFFTEFTVTATAKSADGEFNRTVGVSKESVSGSMILGEEGIYTFEIRGKNPGILSIIYSEEVFVDFGNSEKDKPYIKVKEPILCNAMVYTIDTSGTDSHELDLSRRYYLKTVSGYELMYNVNGTLCTAEICTTAFPKSGTYEVKITAQYMRGGKPSGEIAEKIVNVPVGVASAISRVSTQPTPVAVQQPQNQPTGEYFPVSTFSSAATGECGKDYECPQTSSLGIFATIIAFVIVARLKNKKIKSLY